MAVKLCFLCCVLLLCGVSAIPLNDFYPFGTDTQNQYFKGGNGRYWVDLEEKIIYVRHIHTLYTVVAIC